jgi:hypothetical protein
MYGIVLYMLVFYLYSRMNYFLAKYIRIATIGSKKIHQISKYVETTTVV